MDSFNALQKKPLEESEGFSISLSLVHVFLLYTMAAATLSASFIPFKGSNQIAARIVLRLMGIGTIASGIAKTKETQYLSKYVSYAEVMRQDNFIMKLQPKQQATKAKSADDEQSENEIAIYDLIRLRSEATGAMISGDPGSAKSSVALWLLGWLTQMEAAIIEICDPHAGINRGWADNGFSPVSDYAAIERKFKSALAEFSKRKKRAENGEAIGAKYILVADESDSYRDNFANPDLITKVQTVLGKEGRKYGMILIFISHTSNVTNKGIDAQERDCFCSINLGVSAMARAEKQWGKKSDEYKLLKQQAYPCVIVSSGIPAIAIHPTHSEYTEFKQTGNPPKNLLPINRFQDFSHPPATNTATSHPPAATDYLERVWSMEFDIDSHQSATEPPEEPPATNTMYICPECGSHQSIWHDKRNGRRKCSECDSTWRI